MNTNDCHMKPIIVIPPDTISESDVQQLRDNGICVVVSKDPASLKFLDPIPACIGRSKIEDAAIALSRRLLNRGGIWAQIAAIDRKDIAKLYMEILIKGTSLDSQLDVDEQTFNDAKAEEIRKLASEEARSERAAKKLEKQKATKA